MVKKALLIGINYRGTNAQLNGCINDVHNVREYLVGLGYNDITVLTDDSQTKPTKSNILSSMLNLLLSNAEELFLHYSGHGAHVVDRSGDEDDGNDECIIPLDYQTAGIITDDQIRGLLSFLNANSRLFALLDCCHSGTGMDLAFNYREKANKKKRRNAPQGRMVRNRRLPQTSGVCVMLSGCQDDQYAMDAYEEGQYQGAMSFSFLQAAQDPAVTTWRQLLHKVRKVLADNNYSQLPNLAAGRRIRLREKYTV